MVEFHELGNSSAQLCLSPIVVVLGACGIVGTL